MKKSKYLLLIISICTLCLILAGCAVNAKYTATASKDVGVGRFAFHDANHIDTDGNSSCDICGKQLCDHTSRTHHARVEKTCTTNGNIDYWECTGCGLLYDASSGGNVITLADTVIPAGHNFVDAVCTVCGQKLMYGGYINYVNNNEFSSEAEAKVTETSQPVHENLPSRILPTNRKLNLKGWLIMDGGVTGYGYSVNGGEWIDATAAGSYTGGIPAYTNAFPNITNPGDMALAGFPEADGGIDLDLSAYVGQCVTVVFGAKGNLTGEQYMPVVTIKNVHVKTGFATNIATIEGIEYGGTGTHLSGGILHQNITTQDDAILDIGGWMMADGGQSGLQWSLDGGINWRDPAQVNYLDGGTGHTTAAGANAGHAPAGWKLEDAAFEAQLDLTAYRGKTITVTLGRDATATDERIQFAFIVVTVPGVASHECVGSNWTNNTNGTHTGYCTECKANITEACAAAEGVYEKSEAAHWQNCAKCGVEIDGTRTTHGVPTQTLCTEDKTCPTCAYVITPNSVHKLNGNPASDGNYTTHTITCTALGCGYSETNNCSSESSVATCISHASCDACGGAYGTIDASNHKTPNTTIYVDNSDGTHTQKYDCCKADKEIAAHTISLMTVGNGTYHINKCNYCDYTENVNCSGGSANCLNQATCDICGKLYGEKNGGVHTKSTTHFVDNGNGTHNELYDCCNAVKATDNHTAGSQVYKNSTDHWNTCTACGAVVNQTAHAYKSYTSNGNDTHTGTCTCGQTHTASCSGDTGTKSCTVQATCTTCSSKYGGLATHTYSSTLSYNDSQHFYKCTNTSCSSTKGATNHSFTFVSQNSTTHKGTCTCGKTVTGSHEGSGTYDGGNLQYGGTANDHKHCTMCNYVVTDHTNHVSSTSVTAATCIAQGYTTYYCSCGYKWTGDTTSKNSNNHASPNSYYYTTDGNNTTHTKRYSCCGVSAGSTNHVFTSYSYNSNNVCIGWCATCQSSSSIKHSVSATVENTGAGWSVTVLECNNCKLKHTNNGGYTASQLKDLTSSAMTVNASSNYVAYTSSNFASAINLAPQASIRYLVIKYQSSSQAMHIYMNSNAVANAHTLTTGSVTAGIFALPATATGTASDTLWIYPLYGDGTNASRTINIYEIAWFVDEGPAKIYMALLKDM